MMSIAMTAGKQNVPGDGTNKGSAASTTTPSCTQKQKYHSTIGNGMTNETQTTVKQQQINIWQTCTSTI